MRFDRRRRGVIATEVGPSVHGIRNTSIKTAARKLGFRIRVSLWRYRKASKSRAPSGAVLTMGMPLKNIFMLVVALTLSSLALAQVTVVRAGRLIDPDSGTVL